MYKKLCLLLLSILLCRPALAAHGGHGSSRGSKASKAAKTKTVHVRGHTRKDGTYVAPYDRSARGTLDSGNISVSGYHTPHAYRTGRMAEGYRPHLSVRLTSSGKIKRSTAAKDTFKRQQPCPSTGASSGSCPGYVIDHVKPLECGGADDPSNMEWQTIGDGKAKDRTERYCRN